MGVLGRWSSSYGRGTPVQRFLAIDAKHHLGALLGAIQRAMGQTPGIDSRWHPTAVSRAHLSFHLCTAPGRLFAFRFPFPFFPPSVSAAPPTLPPPPDPPPPDEAPSVLTSHPAAPCPAKSPRLYGQVTTVILSGLYAKTRTAVSCPQRPSSTSIRPPGNAI